MALILLLMSQMDSQTIIKNPLKLKQVHHRLHFRRHCFSLIAHFVVLLNCYASLELHPNIFDLSFKLLTNLVTQYCHFGLPNNFEDHLLNFCYLHSLEMASLGEQTFHQTPTYQFILLNLFSMESIEFQLFFQSFNKNSDESDSQNVNFLH